MSDENVTLTLTVSKGLTSSRLPTRDPFLSSSGTGLTPRALSWGSNQALGLGLGGKPESGLSSPLSARQLIPSGSSSQTFGKFNCLTISFPSEKLQNSGSRQRFLRRRTATRMWFTRFFSTPCSRLTASLATYRDAHIQGRKKEFPNSTSLQFKSPLQNKLEVLCS